MIDTLSILLDTCIVDILMILKETGVIEIFLKSMHWYIVYYAVIFITIIVIFQSLIIDKGLQVISYNVNNVISCGACRQINLLTPPSLYLCFWHSWVGAILDCIPQEVDSGGGQSVVSIIVIFRGFGGHTEYKNNKWKTGNQGSTCHRHILRHRHILWQRHILWHRHILRHMT